MKKIQSWIVLLVAGALLIAIAGVFLPHPDTRGRAELSAIKLESMVWSSAPLSQAIDDVNRQLEVSGRTRSRVMLADVDEASLPRVSLSLEQATVADCAYYLAQFCSLEAYSLPDGIVLDYRHQDHRTWQRRYCDWVRHTLLWK
ncbi:MAG: hypothetical protein AAGD22_08690 [Verrucomicrobiota bacterium]